MQAVTLLRDRRFAPLFATQALGALNENLFRALVILYLLNVRGGEDAPLLTAVAAGCFLAPFFLLSAIAGRLGDRVIKAPLTRKVKLAEIAVVTLGGAALVLDSMPLLLASLVLFGAQAAFFAPLKFSLIPDLLEECEIVAANGLVEGSTFVNILIGTLLGMLFLALDESAIAATLMMIALAVLGWLASRNITERPSAAADLAPGYSPWRETTALLALVRANPPVFRSILAVSWFWLIGGLYVTELPIYEDDPLGSQLVVVLFLAAFAIGIGIGSLLARTFTGGRIDLAPVPLAALVMALFSLDLYFAADYVAGAFATTPELGELLSVTATWRLLFDMMMVSLAGGVFVVPLYALIQARAAPGERARTMAMAVLFSTTVLILAAFIMTALLALGATMAEVFLLTAIGNLIVAWLIIRAIPSYALKGLLQALLRLLYRVEVKGIENIERAGDRTLVVVNHVSWLDGPLMMAFLTELPVFAIFTGTANWWWVKPLWSIANLYALDPTNPLATKDLVAKVKEGRPCVIFPEGRLSVTGALMKVYPGPAFIADKADAVIVPVRIEGAEVSHLSRLGRGEVRRRWFPKIRITILEPRRLQIDEGLRGKARRVVAGLQLYDIMSEMLFSTTRLGPSLFDAFLDARERHGGKHDIIEDFNFKSLNYTQLLRGAMALGRCFEAATEPGEYVGVLLPNTNAAAATFFALQAFGRVPAMLNYSTGIANMESALVAAKVRTVISARAFIEQANLDEAVRQLEKQVEFIWLDELRDEIGLGDKLRAAWDAMHARKIHRSFGVEHDKPAVVLFTSGSEGRPKGVVLSHGSVLANCAQAAARVDYNLLDKCFNALPLFHSFGLTAGFILPTLFGVRVFLYPSPLHYKIVPEMVYGSNATIMFGTNSFLKGYARTADPYDFRSVRYVFAGAEPIQDDTRAIWSDKFGIRILEGYGATEASPSISTNTPMHFRRGTVGRLLPGIEWRLEPVEGLERGGRLWIKGPNVMLGYLRYENPGMIQPPEDGWYDTGDIADIDGEGFVRLLGRAKRFAKLGGEMVSLAAVEDIAMAAAPEESHAVVAVADARKGEKLVLLTTALRLDRAQMLATVRERRASELAVPAEILQVEKIPLLGSGKIDYPSVLELAQAKLAAAPQAAAASEATELAEEEPAPASD